MVERYQLSSHARGDAVKAQYDAHYAGEAPGVGGKPCDSADSATIYSSRMHLLLNVAPLDGHLKIARQLMTFDKLLS